MLTSEFYGPAGKVLGHRTIDQIVRQDLPVSPQNYEVWLSYALRSMPDLVQEMDVLLRSDRPITGAEMEDLYDRFFSTTQLSSQVMETGTRIAREITEALDALGNAGATAQRYSTTLSTAAQTLDSPSIDRSLLKGLIQLLASSTQEMVQQNQALTQKLSRSSDEMQNLRKTLHQARAEALTDCLTGVANRKLFEETLKSRREEAEESGSPLTLLFCDIDHFKRFNDTWGHQTGDQVIKFVAAALGKHALPDHLVARYGGEEFAVIMPRTNLEDAARIAESMRSSIEAKRLVRRATNESIGTVTASFGCSLYIPGEPASDLVARADALLYASKRGGRNRISTDQTLPGAGQFAA
jgi:diguanylate cyclase